MGCTREEAEQKLAALADYVQRYEARDRLIKFGVFLLFNVLALGWIVLRSRGLAEALALAAALLLAAAVISCQAQRGFSQQIRRYIGSRLGQLGTLPAPTPGLTQGQLEEYGTYGALPGNAQFDIRLRRLQYAYMEACRARGLPDYPPLAERLLGCATLSAVMIVGISLLVSTLVRSGDRDLLSAPAFVQWCIAPGLLAVIALLVILAYHHARMAGFIAACCDLPELCVNALDSRLDGLDAGM